MIAPTPIKMIIRPISLSPMFNAFITQRPEETIRKLGSPLRGQRDQAYSIRGVRGPPPPHASLAAPGRLLLLFAETKSSVYHKSRKKEKNIFFPKAPADKPFLYSMKFKYIEKSNGDSNT